MMYVVDKAHLNEVWLKIQKGMEKALEKGGDRSMKVMDLYAMLRDEKATLYVSADLKVAFIVTFNEALDGKEAIILSYFANDPNHSYKGTIYELADALASKVVRLVGYSQRKAIARAIPGAKITRYEFVLETH